MDAYVMWITIGILVLFMITGLLGGLVRGLKRSSLHLLFFIVSVVVAFFITKPICSAILNITITIDGSTLSISDHIVNLIQTSFDISSFGSAVEFITKMPIALLSPIIFLLLTFICSGIFSLIYMIVARLSFGSKKKDFANKKPFRAYGGILGMVEGFLFVLVLFAPITALTKTYQEIAEIPPAETQMLTEGTDNSMKSVAETIADIFPPEVNEAIFAYNDSVIGKIAGTAGIDKAVFDGLANFELNGQKIEFREELLSVVETYNEIAIVSNLASNKQYTSIDLTKLKSILKKVIDNGIFKTVVSDTLHDLVVKFDEIKENLNLTELPQLVQDMINDLQTTFTEENFDMHAYLKHDILKVVDVIDAVFKSDLINEFENLETTELVDILNLVSENNENVKTIINEFFSLNLVEDTFNSIGKFASEELAKVIESEKEIGLNINVENKEQIVEDILSAVNQFLELNEKIDIAELLESTDIIDTLTKTENLGEVIKEIGKTFDSLRNLEVFVLPVTDTRLEKVYVFDNILSTFDLELLNEEVYLTPESTTKTKLNTYTLFFDYISTPIDTANKLGLTDLGDGNTTFDIVLDKILLGLEIKEDILSDILIPFFQIKAMDLKTLVFDSVVNELGDSNNTNGLLSFDKVKTEAQSDTKNEGVHVWDREFTLIGKTLTELNKGSIDVSGINKTYLKALLTGGVEYDTIFKEMIDDENLKTALDPIFEAVSFEGLTQEVFANIDDSILDLTGVKPTTDLTNLKETKTQTIQAIEDLLTITLNNTEFTLPQLGQILDVLKTNAYNDTTDNQTNDGTKDGVFNEIFATVIWYMAGDDITGTGKFANYTANSNASDVKAYLNVSNTDEYYTIESYENIMIELEEVVDFATDLADSVKDTPLSDSTIITYVTNIKGVIDAMKDKAEDEKVDLINDLENLIETNPDRENLLTDEEKTEYGADIIAAINAEYGAESKLGIALKALFGLDE